MEQIMTLHCVAEENLGHCSKLNLSCPWHLHSVQPAPLSFRSLQKQLVEVAFRIHGTLQLILVLARPGLRIGDRLRRLVLQPVPLLHLRWFQEMARAEGRLSRSERSGPGEAFPMLSSGPE
ncbi:hypothetical protein ROHU_027604 [Labeo rohita]|uniref:Uncharacterized protein n=1 Tax=Labeo rohita TaxID=84645 RepID=A0A498MFJ4_LABRO|nr:hypothetical protein ROHU_027604 [Labeo rohita]